MKSFLFSSIGKKIIMAVTGLMLFGFIVGHMIGNWKMFGGIDPATGQYKMDLYGQFLREVGFPAFGRGELLWIARWGLLGALLGHIWAAFGVTQMRMSAREVDYHRTNYVATDYATRTMWVGGILILFYIIFHILHMTTGTLHFQGFEHGSVYANAYYAFRVWYVALIYIIANAILCSHLYHGLWSACQTLGLANGQFSTHLNHLSKAVAVFIFLGYVAVPISCWFGLIPAPEQAVIVGLLQ